MSIQDHQLQDPVFNVPEFTLDGASLTIHATDTIEAAEPPENEVEITKDGRKKWYRKQLLTSPTSHHWRETIANELVHKFLLVDKTRSMHYVLTQFPPGYFLYTHFQTNEPNDDPRKDSYLYGGGHKFRSTHEAYCHLAWLMRGMPPNRCRCVYDNPDKAFRRKQGHLNKVMDQEWKQFVNARSKQEYIDFHRRRQAGEVYQPPPPPVNAFNDALFLRPRP